MKLSEYTIDSYYKATRVANSIFFILLFISLPLYFVVYHIGFNGYLVHEGPVHLQDSLYCISYCMGRCLGVILLGNGLMVSTCAIIHLFTPYYLAKCVSYFISLLTLPVISLILYLSCYAVFGSIWNNVTNVIYGSTSIILGGVLLSLIPPFCRRRAHTLAGMLLFGMNACKIAIKSILWDVFHLSVIPVLLSIIYLMVLRVHRLNIASISISETKWFWHRLMCIGSGAFIRIYFSVVVFYSTFKTEALQNTWPEYQRIAILYASGAVYSILSSLALVEHLHARYYYSILASAGFYLMRMGFAYWVPYQVLQTYRAFDKACVVSRVEWMKKNKKHFVYFEVCRYISVISIVFIPLCITYYIFERYHGDTTSEMSITLSFMRMTFAYLFNGLDGAMIIVYIGQRLSLPQKTAKRVTYTDIIHIYKPAASEIYHA
ncbi:hypothetical protein NEMIN01_0671 [Nematocida minor]|uniref:uncharacterized protein n=1 Tax=Nematocida minor TaxID=1912983 RepID=UPI00221F273C|nr:uncharacterized protein NEMIN01_0671 [Nematocida minor]KAI5189718.1 hypothetical protein NEMIN01_0671 [Nematocida minor]